MSAYHSAGEGWRERTRRACDKSCREHEALYITHRANQSPVLIPIIVRASDNWGNVHKNGSPGQDGSTLQVHLNSLRTGNSSPPKSG
jgi:hypothetical protein